MLAMRSATEIGFDANTFWKQPKQFMWKDDATAHDLLLATCAIREFVQGMTYDQFRDDYLERIIPKPPGV